MFDMLSGQYKNLASKGRHGDTMLAHINPQEAALLKARGGAGTINPRTGLREFFDVNFLKQFQPQPEPLPSLGQALDPNSLANLSTQLPIVTTPATWLGGLRFTQASEQVAPEYSDYADRSPALGMGGGRQVEGYTIPTEQTFQGKPLVAQYDASGNFKQLTLQPGEYLTPDPTQPNIASIPKINAKGEIVDYGVFDLTKQDSGSFGSFVSGLVSDLGPMILAGLGANLAAGNLGFGGGAGAAGAGAAGAGGALSPYAAQAAGAYGGSAAAAAAAAAGDLAGIQAASAAQNALTQQALNQTGITFGQGGATTPTTPTTPTTGGPTTTTPVTPTGPLPDRPLPPGPGITTGTGTSLLDTVKTAGTSIIDAVTKNPTIAGSVAGAVLSAVDAANKPSSTTTTTSIDPQIKAEYLANLERAKQTAAALQARQIAEPGAMYTGAEQQLYNLGMTPFGAADIAKFYNPYEEQVVQGALGDIERARLMQEQANRDQATRAKAFGGSRQAVVSGMTNEAALRQAANTAAQLRSAGYTQAANLGLQARPMDIAGLQTSLGLGAQRTALEQARLDALRNLGQERLGITSGALGLQPANVGGTTSQPLYSSTAGNLLSGGLTGAYIGSLLGKA